MGDGSCDLTRIVGREKLVRTLVRSDEIWKNLILRTLPGGSAEPFMPEAGNYVYVVGQSAGFHVDR
jgi:hypothetical protein